MTVERATKRFLLRFSYIGTRYSGLQRQTSRSQGAADHTTIQGALEKALESTLRPQYPVVLVLSSRTDAHVHAHLNTAHVDLTPRRRSEIDPIQAARDVNRYLRKADHDILLREIVPVPYWYTSRALALRRRYVYRVAVCKNSSNNLPVQNQPLTQRNSALFVNQKLDFDKVQQACELFEGFHDFETFRSTSSDQPDTRKHMEEITFVPDHDSAHMCPYSEHYTWWKFNVVARSFLYRQVRRLVSTVLSVGKNIITLDQVSRMLSEPHRDSWPSNILLGHGHGLYLADIEYDTTLMREDVPPPSWRPPMPYLGKNKILTSRNAHNEESKNDDADMNKGDKD